MKIWPFFVAVIIAIGALLYNPTTKTLSGEIQSVEENVFTIDCTSHIKSRFQPADDVAESCKIMMDESTSIRFQQQQVSQDQLQPGKLVSIELKNEVKLTAKTKDLVAKQITIIE